MGRRNNRGHHEEFTAQPSDLFPGYRAPAQTNEPQQNPLKRQKGWTVGRPFAWEDGEQPDWADGAPTLAGLWLFGPKQFAQRSQERIIPDTEAYEARLRAVSLHDGELAAELSVRRGELYLAPGAGGIDFIAGSIASSWRLNKQDGGSIGGLRKEASAIRAECGVTTASGVRAAKLVFGAFRSHMTLDALEQDIPSVLRVGEISLMRP